MGNNTNYTFKNLIYNTTYYFTVFSLNGSHNMAIQHANATYKHLRPKPIGLKDAKPKIVNLRALNGKASFRYKVGGRFTYCGKLFSILIYEYYYYYGIFFR